MFCSNDWPPGLSYFLVVLNTVAVEGVSVQKTAVDAGHKFLSVHAFHPQKDRAKHLNPSFSAILSHRINMLLRTRACPSTPIRKNWPVMGRDNADQCCSRTGGSELPSRARRHFPMLTIGSKTKQRAPCQRRSPVQSSRLASRRYESVAFQLCCREENASTHPAQPRT